MSQTRSACRPRRIRRRNPLPYLVRWWPALAVVLVLAWASLHVRHTPIPLWQTGYQGGQCVGTVCLIMSPYWELSWDEYATPVPVSTAATVSPSSNNGASYGISHYP